MKRILSMFTVATLTVGLLGSCAKINERLDSLEEKVDGLENEEIATIDSQIASINSSISDLESIRQKVQAMSDPATGLNKRIEDLEAFVSDVKKDYATKDWAKTTLVTMEEYEKTCDTVAKIALKVEGFDSSLKACAESLKGWVNGKFGGYYDIATIDAKLAELQAQVDGVDSLSAELAKTREEIDTAKTAIRAEYRAAITSAIETSEGKLTKALQDSIDSVNATIGTLTGRVGILETKVDALKDKVDSLENMIQTVTIVPAYSDGSVLVDGDSLVLDCIVSPASAVKSLAPSNFTILVKGVAKTKSVADIDSIGIADAKDLVIDTIKGTVSLKVDVSDKLPSPGADSAIIVAFSVRVGKSNYTTDFVAVTAPVSITLDKTKMLIPISDSAAMGQKELFDLTVTVKNATNTNVTWTTSNDFIAMYYGDGKLGIGRAQAGRATVTATTVEGGKSATCRVTVIPSGCLNGEFSVSETGTVIFSQGNFRMQGGYPGFAENQNTSVGNQRGNTIIDELEENDVVDLFCWSTGVGYPLNNNGIHTRVEHTIGFTDGEFMDWGQVFGRRGIRSLTPTTWRTLTKDEWAYLLGNSPKRAGRYRTGVNVNGVPNCTVIVPDNWDLTENPIQDAYPYWSDPSHPMRWGQAQEQGMVCLPPAGSRLGSVVDTVPVVYWSATKDGDDKAYYVKFSAGNQVEFVSGSRALGCAVRLVTDIE